MAEKWNLCWMQGGILGGGHRDLIQTAAGQAKLWEDLSGKEKTAAELLGYDQVEAEAANFTSHAPDRLFLKTLVFLCNGGIILSFATPT